MQLEGIAISRTSVQRLKKISNVISRYQGTAGKEKACLIRLIFKLWRLTMALNYVIHHRREQESPSPKGDLKSRTPK
jgi:hypothetical protein